MNRLEAYWPRAQCQLRRRHLGGRELLCCTVFESLLMSQHVDRRYSSSSGKYISDIELAFLEMHMSDLSAVNDDVAVYLAYDSSKALCIFEIT